jgi:hypothetical protein
MRQLSVLHHGDHRADDALVVESRLHGRVDTLGKVCHGEEGGAFLANVQR